MNRTVLRIDSEPRLGILRLPFFAVCFLFRKILKNCPRFTADSLRLSPQ